MNKAINYAKLFIKRGLDQTPNTYDGNMKLQKLLFFANMVSIAETGKALFEDPILAFKNGCVVENVRLRYRNSYKDLYEDSKNFNPEFTQEEYDIINLTTEIFGKLSAKELSDLTHSFNFWHKAYNNSLSSKGYNKNHSIVPFNDMLNEVDTIKSVILAHKANKKKSVQSEIINGVTFNFPPHFIISDEIISYLEDFSKIAEDNCYSVYLDNESLVIL